MALSDLQTFLVDLFARFDPTLDPIRLSSEVIQPILTRVGTDPFDDDIETFIRTRLQQLRPDLAISEADELTDLLIDPMRVLLEPITREIKLVKLRTSLNNVESLSDDEVDALMANFFEARKSGGYAVGTVRVYFATPQTVSATLVHVASSRDGLRFVPSRSQQITADQMLLNIEGSEYYFDISFTAESRGDEYNVEKDTIVSIANMPTATRVRNPRRFTQGTAREDSVTFVARVQQSSSDKTLTTAPGIVAVLNDAFPELKQVFEIGYGDPEMARDIVKGGSLGAIPSNDSQGSFYGTGTPYDDLNGDSTTSILEASTGYFISRLGAVGTAPSGWYMTLVYTSGSLVAVDVEVLSVVSDTRVKLAHELPLTLGAGAVTWMLRKKEITISDVPGGITFPDSADGTISLSSDEIHIGGKTDIFVAGNVEEASAQITGFTDEFPYARGYAAQTQGASVGNEDLVILTDIDPGLVSGIEPGMSLVLSEGVDVGSYRILETLTSPTRVRIALKLTGSQPGLVWKIVNEIDVDLNEPKDILLEGNDMITGADSNTVYLSGSTNFTDSGTAPNDILFIDDDTYGGDFTITAVNPTFLTIDPPAPRTLSGVHYVISRRSEGVVMPVLRVKQVELLDSTGSPNGTIIPYRDPVLVVSNSFQNEGSGYLYDGPAILGLVSQRFAPAFTTNLNGLTLAWEIYTDASNAWAGVAVSGTHTFGVTSTPTSIVADLNADATLTAQGVRASLHTYGGYSYVGLSCSKKLRVSGGTSLVTLGLLAGYTNCQVRSEDVDFAAIKVRRGDLIECADGNNAGVGFRVITDPTGSSSYVMAGSGPLGPTGTTALYDNVPLRPDAGGRVRIARPSVGSVRCYFLSPTSAEFDYRETRFAVSLRGQDWQYRPDPENARTLLPPPPQTALPDAGTTSPSQLVDTDRNFLLLGIKPGDLLDILYVPITGTSPLPDPANVAVGGLTLILKFDADPFIQIAFPYAMPRQDVVDYINEQVGTTIATLSAGALQLTSSRKITISLDSTALTVLFLSTYSNEHTNAGTYIISDVDTTQLTLSTATPLPVVATTPDTHYRIRRYVQRVSSTEMNLNTDASGLYYVDVEAVSVMPGDYNNIADGIEMQISGHRSDGFRLSCDDTTLSYSRAERLRAQFSTSILVVGAADSPEEYVELNLQNVQITYERSQLVDDIQSFCTSRLRRVVCEDILVRHLLPHYVSLNWSYAGGPSEPDAVKLVSNYLDTLESDAQLEVGNITELLRQRQASSVYTPDNESSTGRSAPLVLVVMHAEDRKIKGALVRDIVDTVRTQRFIADSLTMRRLSSSGIR